MHRKDEDFAGLENLGFAKNVGICGTDVFLGRRRTASVRLAYSGMGAWRIARLWQMNQALSNKRLHQYGLILPWTFAEAAPEKY